MSTQNVKISAGGGYGITESAYEIDDNGILHIVEHGDTMNLQGNDIANSFDGHKFAEIDFEKISSEMRCTQERCGCHLCNFFVFASFGNVVGLKALAR